MHNQDYHQILQFSHHGLIATDKDGLVTFVNKRAKKILQLGRKKVVGTPIWKHLPQTGKRVAACLETGKPQSCSQVFGKHVNLVDVLATLEREMLKTAKRHCRTTRDMAKFLNISQPSVIRKLKKHRLSSNLINKRIKK